MNPWDEGRSWWNAQSCTKALAHQPVLKVCNAEFPQCVTWCRMVLTTPDANWKFFKMQESASSAPRCAETELSGQQSQLVLAIWYELVRRRRYGVGRRRNQSKNGVIRRKILWILTVRTSASKSLCILSQGPGATTVLSVLWKGWECDAMTWSDISLDAILNAGTWNFCKAGGDYIIHADVSYNMGCAEDSNCTAKLQDNIRRLQTTTAVALQARRTPFYQWQQIQLHCQLELCKESVLSLTNDSRSSCDDEEPPKDQGNGPPRQRRLIKLLKCAKQHDGSCIIQHALPKDQVVEHRRNVHVRKYGQGGDWICGWDQSTCKQGWFATHQHIMASHLQLENTLLHRFAIDNSACMCHCKWHEACQPPCFDYPVFAWTWMNSENLLLMV